MPITRRSFISGGAAIALSLGLPLPAFASPWVFVGSALASGALSFVGQMYVQQFFGKETGLTNEQVVEAIRQSTDEIKAYVSEDVRKALTEDRVKELEAKCEALVRNLTDYASSSKVDSNYTKYLLDYADIASSDGIALADRYSPLALPVLSNFVSLRIFVKRAQYLRERDEIRYRNFARELRQFAILVKHRVSDYDETLSPDRRLGKVSCTVRESGGQLPTRELTCSFTVDGEVAPPNVLYTLTQGPGSDGKVAAQLEQRRQQRARELQAYQEKVDAHFLMPLRDIAAKWLEVARKIDPTSESPDPSSIYINDVPLAPGSR
ncbi:hypothetical protein [Burkholderia glumae]|uniref:hypothetical protein n=1 Tax=Burkholderia glumae TaxID=337 RepID=UPI0020CD0E97|nr:hypothetical protein [Burkholderia glumae]MCQ0034327.1 hypothetical protein [Burkholderia glumae]MCQ0038723.1 hypothetical protein [Burkholderia glumae]